MKKHIRLTALLLALLMIAACGVSCASEGEGEEDYRTELESSMNSASASYFGEMLTQTLEAQFSIQTGDVRCAVKWENNGENLAPTRVTVYLSGKAIWQDPRAIEAFVGELLGCECITVIE